jgi:SNF2 family DNA or RNA helicase
MAHADLRDGRIVVDTRWNEKEQVKLVPGTRWDPVEKHWHLPPTWAACLQLRGVFQDSLTIGDDLNLWAWKARQRSEFLIAMRTAVDLEKFGGDVRNAPGLYPFQSVGATFIHLAREAILADEMGTGKTIQALTALGADGLPAVVICPNSVKFNWATEAARWNTDATPYVVTSGAVGRAKTLNAAAADPTALVIVNYETLRMVSRLSPYGDIRLRRCRQCDKKYGEEGLSEARCQVHPKVINRIPFKTVILDEAHRIKSPQAQQTRAAWAVCHQSSVEYRWALTGTPIGNHPGDFWSILHAIAPLEFPTKTHYVDRYCLQSWNAFGGLDIVGLNPAHREEFYRIIDPHMRRMPKELVLDQLPPKVRSVRYVELSTKQLRMYRDFDETLLVYDDNEQPIVASTALTAKLRQMQLSSATIHVADGRVRMTEPAPKLDVLDEVLDELGDRPLVVCAQSRQLIELATARLEKANVPHGLITGAVHPSLRDQVLQDFQSGKLRVLLFTVQAGGTGLTMTAADTILFLQRSWSMLDNKQAEDRVHRIGAEVHESIHIIDVVARDTVEEGQIESLHNKFLRLQEITRDRQVIATAEDRYRLDLEEEMILGSEL